MDLYSPDEGDANLPGLTRQVAPANMGLRSCLMGEGHGTVRSLASIARPGVLVVPSVPFATVCFVKVGSSDASLCPILVGSRR